MLSFYHIHLFFCSHKRPGPLWPALCLSVTPVPTQKVCTHVHWQSGTVWSTLLLQSPLLELVREGPAFTNSHMVKIGLLSSQRGKALRKEAWLFVFPFPYPFPPSKMKTSSWTDGKWCFLGPIQLGRGLKTCFCAMGCARSEKSPFRFGHPKQTHPSGERVCRSPPFNALIFLLILLESTTHSTNDGRVGTWT